MAERLRTSLKVVGHCPNCNNVFTINENVYTDGEAEGEELKGDMMNRYDNRNSKGNTNKKQYQSNYNKSSKKEEPKPLVKFMLKEVKLKVWQLAMILIVVAIGASGALQ